MTPPTAAAATTPRRREHAEPEVRRAVVADRLLDSSAKHSFDPFTEIDWDAEPVPGLPYMPLEKVTLYGTPLWDTLTEDQRIELSKHEFLSAMQVGLWFEVILMQLLARYTYDLNPQSAHAQYALTELGDETRHSIMFARTAAKFGVPHYKPARLTHELARVAKATLSGPSMWASILVAEEMTDRMQRSMMDDEEIQPHIRAVNKIHVIEEARHVRFAREEIEHAAPGMHWPAKEIHRHITATLSYMIADSLVDPKVYLSVGISPREGRAAALANPHHQQCRRWMAEKIVAFLREADLIGGPSTLLWKRGHLI
ncbi:MAG: AurF N-oxygenase family protein [Sporichthyaceae bacterium]